MIEIVVDNFSDEELDSLEQDDSWNDDWYDDEQIQQAVQNVVVPWWVAFLPRF